MSDEPRIRLVAGTTVQGMFPEEGAAIGGGGGGGDMSDLETRIKALEEDRREMRADVTAIRVDLGEIKGLLKSAPSAIDFGELKGRVSALPTTAKLATVVAIIGGVFTIIANWDKVTPVLKSWLGV